MSEHRKNKMAENIDGWMSVTIPARQYVYALLERELQEAMRRSSELDLQACVEIGSRPMPKGQHVRVDDVPPSNLAAQTQLLVAEALNKALEVLQAEDEYFCPDCDEIHMPDIGPSHDAS
jgi:hypothetical protein